MGNILFFANEEEYALCPIGLKMTSDFIFVVKQSRVMLVKNRATGKIISFEDIIEAFDWLKEVKVYATGNDLHNDLARNDLPFLDKESYDRKCLT